MLPRQTCGLYTHTIYRNKYPGGIAKLDASIKGGELFETVLHNPVNIYMTHMSNYANDRLAHYTFTALIEFVQTYTNLHLKFAASTALPASTTSRSSQLAPSFNAYGHQLGPAHLARYYFDLYPDEKEPLWTVSAAIVLYCRYTLVRCLLSLSNSTNASFNKSTSSHQI